MGFFYFIHTLSTMPTKHTGHLRYGGAKHMHDTRGY